MFGMQFLVVLLPPLMILFPTLLNKSLMVKVQFSGKSCGLFVVVVTVVGIGDVSLEVEPAQNRSMLFYKVAVTFGNGTRKVFFVFLQLKYFQI